MDGKRLYVLPSRASATRVLQSLHSGAVPLQPSLPSVVPRLSRVTIENFGRAIVELLECSRCFLKALPRDGSPGDEVYVGCEAPGSAGADAIAHVCRESGKEATVQPLAPASPVARSLIGQESSQHAHAVKGTLTTEGGSEVVFLAGWRAKPLPSTEIPYATRAVRLIWAAADSASRPQSENTGLEALLEGLIFPAFVVDARLRLHYVNSSGRQILAKRWPLRAVYGTLAGSSASITNCLKRAAHSTTLLRSQRTWTNTTIPLSTEQHKRSAFAWIGAMPTPCDTDRLLIVIPQIDVAAGAKRIATAFALTAAEERIVARILQGQLPACIGAALGLTEGTVRTYTKRIMFKLGIKRRSELFLLYVLTLSPFGAGQRERTLSSVALRSGHHREADRPSMAAK